MSRSPILWHPLAAIFAEFVLHDGASRSDIDSARRTARHVGEAGDHAAVRAAGASRATYQAVTDARAPKRPGQLTAGQLTAGPLPEFVPPEAVRSDEVLFAAALLAIAANVPVAR